MRHWYFFFFFFCYLTLLYSKVFFFSLFWLPFTQLFRLPLLEVRCRHYPPIRRIHFVLIKLFLRLHIWIFDCAAARRNASLFIYIFSFSSLPGATCSALSYYSIILNRRYFSHLQMLASGKLCKFEILYNHEKICEKVICLLEFLGEQNFD